MPVTGSARAAVENAISLRGPAAAWGCAPTMRVAVAAATAESRNAPAIRVRIMKGSYPSVIQPGSSMPGQLRASRFVLAAVVAAFFVLSAPYIGQVRSSIRSAFPGQFVRIVGSAVALMVAASIVVGLVRIRERRPMRYGVLAASLGLARVVSC